MADHGEIYFAATNESAPFITVNENTSTALLGTFMEKYWRLNRPEVFISVTGGAQDFQLSSRMQRAFNKGLVSAASSTNAWVVTGGTDTGVMKLVANAFEEGFVHHVPLIAVTSYGCVNGREVCEGARGERVTYASTQGASVTGAPLNPFHTHFVFVDSGKVAPEAWGKEISLRSNLEATYTQLKGVPLVLLVVQGGPGTLQTVLSMAHLQQAILVVRDSGGAADAIADYVLNGKTDDPKFQSEKLQATLATIKELQASSADALLTFFTLQDDEEMSTMLLKALNKTLKPTTNSLLRGSLAVRREMSRNSEAVALAEVRARALTLAVKWNRVDMGQALLHAMSTEMQFTYGHHVALMFMLERGRVELFRLIAACPGFDVSAVNMCKLYFQAEDKYNVLDSPELMGRLYTNVSSISSMTLDKRTGKPTETHELYKHLVCPFIVSLVPELEPIFENSDKVRAHDLFLWAILIGHDELIFEFWKHTEMPVRVALLGAALARSMTERMQFGRKECLDRARRLEEWAIGLMDTVRPQANGAQILSARVPEWGPKMLIDTAMQLEMKEFVSHRTCQALMDVWWRGGYPGGTVQLRDADSLVRVWFYVVCPPLNPYVKQKRPRHKSLISVGAREFTHITDAVLHTYRLSKRETVNAGGTVPELVMGKPRPERLEHILSAAQEVASEEQALKYAKSAEIGAAASRLPSSQGTLVGFYSIPAVKLVVRFSFHILLLLNYAIVLVRLKTIDEVRHTGVPSPTLWEGIFWVQAIAYYLDELYQSIKLKRAKVRPMVNFGWLMSSGDKLLMLAFFCRAASLLKRAPECAGVYECSGAFMARVLYSFFQVTLSLVVIVLSLRIISFRTVDEQLGVLVIMVEHMFNDLALFLELGGLVTIGFMLSIAGLTSASSWTSDDDLSEGSSGGVASLGDTIEMWPPGAPAIPLSPPTGRRALHGGGGALSDEHGGDVSGSRGSKAEVLMFWAIFGEFDLDFIDENVPFGQPVLFVYALIASIVLVNLLVAMFSDTYTKIKLRSETEFRFQKKYFTFLYLNIVHVVPPPFNLPWILTELHQHYFGEPHDAADTVEEEDVPALVRSGTRSLSTTTAGFTTTRGLNGEGTMYMEAFLKSKAEAEAASMAGLVEETNSSMHEMKHLEAVQLDALKDMQRSVKQIVDELKQVKEAKSPVLAEMKEANTLMASKLDELARQVAGLAAAAQSGGRFEESPAPAGGGTVET